MSLRWRRLLEEELLIWHVPRLLPWQYRQWRVPHAREWKGMRPHHFPRQWRQLRYVNPHVVIAGGESDLRTRMC